MSGSYDVVVIGGGPGGYVAAIRASQLGLKAACIESRGALGGTCLNVGCIPSKALLESSEVFEKTAHHSHEYGVHVEKVQADIKAMIQRKADIVSKFTRGIEGLFKKNKVDYLKGKGAFVSPFEVSVTADDGSSQTVKAKNIIIATGSDIIELPIAPFDHKIIVDSTDALSFTKAPKNLVVIGGGVIGLELGSVWRRLGSSVTVLEAAPRFLPMMDSSISKAMSKIMAAQGMEIHVDTLVTEVKKKAKGATVIAQHQGETLEFAADKVLVAVGRYAYTEGLQLEKAGITPEKNGKIPVNSQLQTSVPHIYAIGDVIAGPMLAHKAEEEGIAAAEHIAGKPTHINYRAIPSIIYTWPEVATVGLSEEQCQEQGLKYKTGQFPFLANGRAACLGCTDGFVKFIADAHTDELLGAHMVGPHVSELVGEVAIAFEYRASAEDIARSVHAHPTLAEVIKEAALAVNKEAIHI